MQFLRLQNYCKTRKIRYKINGKNSEEKSWKKSRVTAWVKKG